MLDKMNALILRLKADDLYKNINVVNEDEISSIVDEITSAENYSTYIECSAEKVAISVIYSVMINRIHEDLSKKNENFEETNNSTGINFQVQILECVKAFLDLIIPNVYLSPKKLLAIGSVITELHNNNIYTHVSNMIEKAFPLEFLNEKQTVERISKQLKKLTIEFFEKQDTKSHGIMMDIDNPELTILLNEEERQMIEDKIDQLKKVEKGISSESTEEEKKLSTDLNNIIKEAIKHDKSDLI